MARSPCKVRVRNSGFLLAFALLSVRYGVTQSMPTTAGETLSGKPVVLADVVRGRASVLVAGFSREGGFKTGEWVKSLHGDPAFAHLPVYQVAEIAAAPGFVRGMIRNGMKKGLTPAQQDAFIVLISDEDQWKTYLGVTTDTDPYVILIDAQGKILWHGHGAAANLEPLVRTALR